MLYWSAIKPVALDQIVKIYDGFHIIVQIAEDVMFGDMFP